MEEMTLEQQRALALARARLRLQESPPSSSGATGSWEAPQRTIDHQVARQAGLAVRAGIEGLGALPAMVGDAAFSLSNLVQRALGIEDLPPPGRTTRALSNVLTRLGLPEAENPTERVVQDATKAMAGVGGIAGVAGRLPAVSESARQVLQQLSGNVPGQVASAAAGGAASGMAREADMPAPVQFGAGIVGGMVPRAVAPKFFSQFDQPSTTFQTQAERNIDTFRAAGTMPSAGQATESNFFRALENLASRFPGGQGVIQRFRENQQNQLGQSTQTGGSAERAGRAIESGLRGDGGFIARTRAIRERLYDKLDDFLPSNQKIETTNTQRVLADLNADIPGAPALSQLFKNSRIVGIEEALQKDLAQGTQTGNPVTPNQIAMLLDQGAKRLPYEAIKKLRTIVGEQMDNASIVSDVPRSKWKALYAALSEDLGEAARRNGKEATQAWERANNYNRAVMSRVEQVLDRVLGTNRNPEDIFRAVSPTNPDQMTTIRTVMRSLRPEERQIVSDAIIARLGRATPGRQDDVGSVFSSETFLTNYSKISPQAREVLFPTESQRRAVEAIAKAASNIRDGNQVFANPSGTAGAAAPYVLGGMAVSGIPGALTAGAMVAGSRIGAKMLTNPTVVQWLAQGTKLKPAQMASHIARLGTIFNRTGDPELRAELTEYMKSIEQQNWQGQ